MDLPINLSPFLAEFSTLTSLIQTVVPSVNCLNVCEGTVITEKAVVNDEVYSGLPTVVSSKKLSEAMDTILHSISNCRELDYSKFARMMRPLLTRMELLSVLANTFNLFDAECRIWDSILRLSEQSGRFLDASHALVNRLLAELLNAELNSHTGDSLLSKARELRAVLDSHRVLLDTADEATVTGQLPTPHAHLQSVFINLGRAYLENYMDWGKFVGSMELIPLRFSDFFNGKSWAAVCARGYYYWLHLHARCVFGTGDATDSLSNSCDTETAVAPPPMSMLHAAVVVRMHGRTLVQFMRQCCEQKLAKRQKQQQRDETNKENVYAEQLPKCTDAAEADIAMSSKTIPWGSAQLTDHELLNLWLGTRLLIRGCQQVAELYTLLGSVREARAYQDELLRIGQRFHICGVAQTAIALMAHVELFALRKWAFELRLRQLNHIVTCQISLAEIAHELDRRNHLSGPKCIINGDDDDIDEAAFLHLGKKTVTTREANGDLEDNLTAEDALSVAANPLVAANVHAFATIFPCSPTRLERGKTNASAQRSSFPTVAQLASLISGRPYSLCLDPDASPDDVYSRLDRDARAVGCYSFRNCIGRVLNGANWPWLHEVTSLVRKQLLPAAHFLPAAVLQAASSNKPTATNQSEDNLTQALLNAFESLTVSPEAFSKLNRQSLNTTVTATALDKVVSNDVQLRTGPVMLPPPPPPNAPLRLADRRHSRSTRVRTEASVVPRSRTGSAKDRAFHRESNSIIPNAEKNIRRAAEHIQPKSDMSRCTPRRAQSAVSAICQVVQPEAVRQSSSSLHNDAESETECELMILRQLGYHLAPQRKPTQRTRVLQFYVDNETDEDSRVKNKSNSTRHSRASSAVDPVESCPSLTNIPPRPRNLRLASRWQAEQQRSNATLHAHDLSPLSPNNASDAHDQELHLAQAMEQAQLAADSLAEQVESAYRRLSVIPVPSLLRPVCHWLGLRWLGKGSQTQAARYFGQSVGIAATSLYISILSSRLSEVKPSQSATALPSTAQLTSWSYALKRIREFVAPNHPLNEFRTTTAATVTTAELKQQADTSADQIRAIQFCLVDEIAATSLHASSHKGRKSVLLDSPTGHDPVPLGLGARTAAYLVATCYTGLSASEPSALRAETRVLHGFTEGGLKTLDSFDELQVESLDSMQIEDRVRYWRTRYKLDSRLESLLSEMHRDWFTPGDLNWLLGSCSSSTDRKCSQPKSIVLILDRRLTYLPWEWILSPTGGRTDTSQQPTFTRSFSLPLVLGHLVTSTNTTTCTGNTVQPGTGSPVSAPLSPRSTTRVFDPRHTYYVLNPEANLSFTQQTFEPIFQSFPTWRGVVGRKPTTEEVNLGFTNHDLFIYLGHGNGSRFLLQTFNQGMNARAVTLVLGCSSGKPRWEGRHEPYSSLFNHLIAGCPFVAGLLWDVTDRDVDRFTLEFLTQWLCDNRTADPARKAIDARPSLGACLFNATSACKLKHLVGKSVIVYGLPLDPDPNSLLSVPMRP